MLRVAVVCVALVCVADVSGRLNCTEKNLQLSNGTQPFACESDGTYSAKQCRGTVCYCVDEEGSYVRYNTRLSKSANKTCHCARDDFWFDLSDTCTEDGSYRSYWCELHICYCIDEYGQRLKDKGPAVERKDLDSLNC